MGADERQLLEVAQEVAHAAGALLVEHYRGEVEGLRTKTTPTDPVSAADLAAEARIREILAARRPGDAVLGEEGGEVGPGTGDDPPGALDDVAHGRPLADATGIRWIVDPLDGTVNFLFRLPQWSVSIACEDAEGTIAGVVHDPLRGETFAATRNGPATLNGTPLTPSTRAELATALIVTGFSYDAARRAQEAAVVARLLPQVRDVRRLGSAALDLVWTAAGRCDAYYEYELQPWDCAAGALICRRAGLEVLPLADGHGHEDGLLAAPPALAGPLLALVGA